MKCLVKEVENEGLAGLLGQTVTLFCGIYIYTGELVGVNESCVKLSDAKIVYETGPLTDKLWKDVQTLPTEKLYVQRSAIEAFGVTK